MADGFKSDFSGYATKNDVLCSDGRVIRKDAFADQDGTVVPLVFQHDHTSPLSVIGKALLENRDDGVYAYGYLNDTDAGKAARGIIQHGDMMSLSIAANKVKGIRCALCGDVFSAKATREHNDANILAMGARVTGPGLALEIVKAFLATEFEGGRHKRRVDMLDNM